MTLRLNLWLIAADWAAWLYGIESWEFRECVRRAAILDYEVYAWN